MSRSPQIAPDYALHRENVQVVDVLASLTTKEHGINMGAYRVANIQVVPKTGAGNPTVNVMFWSEAAGKFIQQHTPIALAPVGAGLAWEHAIEANGRIMIVALTGTLTGGVDVYVGGFDTTNNTE